jgi:hypothetical protein
MNSFINPYPRNKERQLNSSNDVFNFKSHENDLVLVSVDHIKFQDGNWYYVSDLQYPAALQLLIINAGDVQANSAYVTWGTNKPSDTKILYGPSLSNLNQQYYDSTLTLFHGTLLTGLNLQQNYYFQVISSNGIETVSSIAYQFTTTNQVTVFTYLYSPLITTCVKVINENISASNNIGNTQNLLTIAPNADTNKINISNNLFINNSVDNGSVSNNIGSSAARILVNGTEVYKSSNYGAN